MIFSTTFCSSEEIYALTRCPVSCISIDHTGKQDEFYSLWFR